MARAIGMKFVSRARIRYVRDYLMTGVGRWIKPCAMISTQSCWNELLHPTVYMDVITYPCDAGLFLSIQDPPWKPWLANMGKHDKQAYSATPLTDIFFQMPNTDHRVKDDFF